MTTAGSMPLQAWLSSALWIGATLAAYGFGLGVRRLARGAALANPVLVAIALLVAALLVTGTPYAAYVRATWPITALLGPATVALGLPLAQHIGLVRRSCLGVVLGLLAGSLAAMLSGVALVRLLGGTPELALSMLPRAATTPIAMALADQIGGAPTLTAALAILGGITAAIALQAVLGALRIDAWHAIGLAAGTAGSGIAAARVAPLSETAAAFAAIGIGLNGLLTAVLAPMLCRLLF